MTTTIAPARADVVRAGFEHLHAADPVLAELIDRRPNYDPDAWLERLPQMDLFGCLVFQVLGQQISVTAADSIFERLIDRCGGSIPSPDGLLRIERGELRELGFSWRKADTVLELAAHFADDRLSEARLSELPDDEIIAELTQIKGIGPWTVHGALLLVFRRGDIVAVGDLSLRQAVRRFYGFDHLPTEDEMLEVAEPWRPYGSLGANLLFAGMELDPEEGA